MKFDPSLYLILSTDLIQKNLDDFISNCIKSGVTTVQLREKSKDSKSIYELALRLKSLLKYTSTSLIINDRVDIALAAKVDGVHLGQTDLPISKAREILGEQAIIGLSVENQGQVINANHHHLDYVGISPVFETNTKTGLSNTWGMSGVEWVSKHSNHKTVAIGGITTANAGSVIEAGADGLAICSAICSARHPFAVTSRLQKIIKLSRGYE